jgi:ankyrin repeat protein
MQHASRLSLLSLVVAAGLAGCAPGPAAPTAHAPRPSGHAPAPEAAGRFLDAVRRGDLATVQHLLDGDPGLAGSRTAEGRSAVQLALFRIQDNQEDLYPAADNPVLRAILAVHPALDPFETAAVGDPAALAALVAADPALVTRVHPIGWTALDFAAFGGNPGAVRLLLDRGAAIEQRARNKFANTPLHVALLTGDRATVALLIDRGADLAARYDGGITPLHLAASLGRVDLLALLLDHGAPINARSDAGATALAGARRGQRATAIELLRQRGAQE